MGNYFFPKIDTEIVAVEAIEADVAAIKVPYAIFRPFWFWLRFSTTFQDGKAGIDGSICNNLTQIKFRTPPENWFSICPLCCWRIVRLRNNNLVELYLFRQSVLGLTLRLC